MNEEENKETINKNHTDDILSWLSIFAPLAVIVIMFAFVLPIAIIRISND